MPNTEPEKPQEKWSKFPANPFNTPDEPTAEVTNELETLRQDLSTLRAENEKLSSHIRDMESTYTFGASVMNSIMIPNANKMLHDECALEALQRWVNELSTAQKAVEWVKEHGESVASFLEEYGDTDNETAAGLRTILSELNGGGK